MPADTRADDVWATRAWVEVETLSGDGVTRAAVLPGGTRAALLRDPDGHLIVVAEVGRSG